MKRQPGHSPPVRDLVLVGGGHAHVQVLKRFGMDPEPGIRITMVSEHFSSPYSGMLPGCIAGTYQPEDIEINLANLCQYAGARFIRAEVTGVDRDTNRLHVRDRPSIYFDVLSINTGAVPVSPFPEAIAVKPISDFLPKWVEAKEKLIAKTSPSVLIVGAGAGGCELALAMSASLPHAKIKLVGRQLLPGHNAKARSLISNKFAQRDIDFVAGEVSRVTSDDASLSTGESLEVDEVFWVTGVQAPTWFRESGFQVDDDGFVMVDAMLRTVDDTHIFAAGDAAHLTGQTRAKSGVYAVRAGPVLSNNLRSALIGEPLKKFRAQKEHLALLGDGRGRAIASRSRWASESSVWWHLKDYIDRKFMSNFNELPPMPQEEIKINASLAASVPEHDMRCGGCGAKIAAEPLRRVLDRLELPQHPDVLVAVGDDAAHVITHSGSQLMTIDGFRAMINDPYLFGRIATHHSLNDIFAMGAAPKTAMTLVTVPLMADAMVEEELYQLMRGVVDVLTDHGAFLVGGHSAEGLELSLGLSVQAEAPTNVIAKGGAKPGDVLLLTKPLGTGTTLAAAMQSACDAQSLTEVVSGMDRSNATAAQILCDHDVHALTDVTGFGLIGHLGEMMRASGTGIVLDIESVPIYGAATRLIERYPSSLQSSNELSFTDYELKGSLRFADPAVRMLADPQTSGGLLAAVEVDRVQSIQEHLQASGEDAYVIGSVTARGNVIQ